MMFLGRPLLQKSVGLQYQLVNVLVVRRLGHLGLLQLPGLLDRLTLDLTLHILELGPHLQIPAPEQEVTATRKPSVVDTRR